MIWAVVTKEEMEGYKIPPVFQYYREVVGKENIRLAIVDEDDSLDFIGKDDIVLLRSANKRIIEEIKSRGIISTAEDYEVYEQVRDKAELSTYLQRCGINVPKQFSIHEVEDGKAYFVKPRFGGESFGITKDSICHTKADVERQVKFIEDTLNQDAVIEEYIHGVDCTVACYYDPLEECVKASAITVECDEVGGIQTHKGKFDYNEYCSAVKGYSKEVVNGISKYVFNDLLKLKHHARIDYRIAHTGGAYLIDVNLLPGLGPSAHFAKCMLLTENQSYKDAIWAIIRSAIN